RILLALSKIKSLIHRQVRSLVHGLQDSRHIAARQTADYRQIALAGRVPSGNLDEQVVAHDGACWTIRPDGHFLAPMAQRAYDGEAAAIQGAKSTEFSPFLQRWLFRRRIRRQ